MLSSPTIAGLIKNAWLLMAAGLGLVTGQVAFADEPVAPAVLAKEDGAISLWNGRDLTGWIFVAKESTQDPAKAWAANDGVLKLLKIESFGYIRTEANYENYHLHVEWRWPEGAGNSGVMVHVQPPDVVWPAGVEIQLKSGNAGQLIATPPLDFEGGEIERAKRRKARLADSNEKPSGEWNTCDIFCREDTIEIYVNGLRQNHAGKLTITSGHIGLQSEGAAIDFRNLWLKRL